MLPTSTCLLLLVLVIIGGIFLLTMIQPQNEGFADQVVHAVAGGIAGPMVGVEDEPELSETLPRDDMGSLQPAIRQWTPYPDVYNDAPGIYG